MLKLVIFNSVFMPILLTYANDHWVTIERLQSEIQMAERESLQRISGIILLDKVPSLEIKKTLEVDMLLLGIERSQLQYYTHVIKKPQERIAR